MATNEKNENAPQAIDLEAGSRAAPRSLPIFAAAFARVAVISLAAISSPFIILNLDVLWKEKVRNAQGFSYESVAYLIVEYLFMSATVILSVCGALAIWFLADLVPIEADWTNFCPHCTRERDLIEKAEQQENSDAKI